MSLLGLLACRLPAQNYFSDVASDDADGHWITDAAYHQLMEGFPGGAFLPNQPLSRAEAVMVLARLLNVSLKGFMLLPGPADTRALPARTTVWMTAAAQFLAEQGKLSPVISDGFSPNLPMTRGDFLLALAQLAGDGSARTPATAFQWGTDESLAPLEWDNSLAVPITRRETARLLERTLIYLTQHAVTEGKIVEFSTDDTDNRWVTLDTPIGAARLVLPPRGVLLADATQDDLRPGARIRTLSDTVSGKNGLYYRVREVRLVR